LIFRFLTQQFEFRAVQSIFFPFGKAGNVFRGALGTLLPAVLVRAFGGPSGLADPPRPFVLRAAHLDGCVFAPGAVFSLNVHVFDLKGNLFATLTEAFRQLSHAGLGPRRGLVELMPPGPSVSVEVDLADGSACQTATVHFVTPTELKGMEGSEEVPFDVLFARARDRVSSLASLYGDGAPDIDFAGLGQRAKAVRTLNCQLTYRDVVRRSSRTGQTHGIGGFTGTVSYQGNLTEFMPYLRAAFWTGVGRHTVWGNGVIQVE
jgi:hypothetical protein